MVKLLRFLLAYGVILIWNILSQKSITEDIAIGEKDLGFDSWVGRVERSVANDSPTLRRFFGAVLPWRCAAEMGLATRYMLPRNTASIIKI